MSIFGTRCRTFAFMKRIKLFRPWQKTISPPQKFLMLFPGRTGSSYITEKLDAYPNVIMAGEILDYYYEEVDDKKRVNQQIETIKSFYSQKYSANITALGFKAKLYPGHWTENSLGQLKDTLEFCKVNKVIILLRKNEVKHAISALLSLNLKDKGWNIMQELDMAKEECIDYVEFSEMLVNNRKQAREVLDFSKKLNASKLTIYYEETLENEEDLFRKIYDFLDVVYHKTSSMIKKHVNDNLSLVVTNIKSLQSMYIGTPLENMFYE